MKYAAIRWLSTLSRAARAARRAMAFPEGTFPVNSPLEDGYVDTVVLHLDGTIAVSGWSRRLDSFRDQLAITIDGAPLACMQAYRVRRPDLAAVLRTDDTFLGSVVEWVCTSRDRDRQASLRAGNRELITFPLPAQSEPAYAHLRTDSRPLGRDDIYGSGPPVTQVSPEVFELARTLPPPVLDFGCGAGALVRALRSAGIEAYGLELDEERIRQHLLADARPWVTLYDGRFPSPFRDRQFMSICCSEVLEHIPNPVAVIGELARLSTTHLLVTVPDMSAIPRGFHHGVVPWHLLESTHVNFFTQNSLTTLLAPSASRIEIARLGQVACDRMAYYTSLAAVVER